MVDPQHDNGVKMALWKVVGGDGLERDLLLVKNPCFLTVAIKCISGLRSKDRYKIIVSGERAKQT